jgi:quinolinate synthase
LGPSSPVRGRTSRSLNQALTLGARQDVQWCYLRPVDVQVIDPTLDLEDEIQRLRKERNAVILAHYYQDSEIQHLADFIGDSLQLARAARDTDADVIVFCGVHFMAETAKILNPDRTVLLPDLEAGCSLASGCPGDRFRAWRARHPDAVAISYINCSAEVKAASDLICTSSNAVKMVESVPEGTQILFAPDKNLGRWLIRETGRDMTLWQGTCIVHETFSHRKLIGLKTRHPNAKIIAHPECEDHILNMADVVGSTSRLLEYATTSEFTEFIVATEPGIITQMELKAPNRTYIPAPPEANCACNECPFMRLNTLEKLYLCLRDMTPELTMPDELRLAAKKPIDRMLELSAAVK